MSFEKRYVIAVDIGTTSTKTLVVGRDGTVFASHAVEYPLFTPEPGAAEQNPDEIFAAVIRSIRESVRKAGLSASQILCVSFSSAMHSIIAVDRNGHPLTPCIVWADNRSARYADILKRDGKQIYMDTGTPIHPMSPLLKLMWLKDERPDIAHKANKYIGIKEFVFAKLFGRFVVDYSIASASGLFNLRRLDWDERALAAAGITREMLSEPVPPTYRLEGLDPQHAADMGLSIDTPFVAGGSDGVLANLGVDAVGKGVYAVTIGTSGAVRGVVRSPVADPQGRLFCYALTEDYWVVGGPINNGGIMFRWARDQLATLEAEQARSRGLDPYDYLTEMAAGVSPGSEGLVFLPLLAGERAPFWNANARGVFFGLSLNHEKRHMVRSVLEGVVYRIHSVMSALEEFAGKAVEIRASGGFARSPLWRQMMADVLGTKVAVPDTIESSCLGAAFIGFYAMGEASGLHEVSGWVRTGSEHVPDERNNRIYGELLQIYNRVYHRLKDEFDEIAAFQQKYGRGSE